MQALIQSIHPTGKGGWKLEKQLVRGNIKWSTCWHMLKNKDRICSVWFRSFPKQRTENKQTVLKLVC